MSVLPMQRVTICALKKDRKAILELLQRQGVVEIHRTELSDSIFGREDMSAQQSQFTKNAATADKALEILDARVPAEGRKPIAALEGRKALTVDEYNEKAEKREETFRVCQRILELDHEAAENAAEAPRIEAQKVALEPWLSDDLPLDFTGTRDTTAFTGTLPGQVTLPDLLGRLSGSAGDDAALDAYILSTGEQQTCVFVICVNRLAQKVEAALRTMGFAKPPQSALDPVSEQKKLQERLAGLDKKNAAVRDELLKLREERAQIAFSADYYRMRADKYSVIGELAQSRRTFVLEGYIPARDAPALEKMLSGLFDCTVGFETPADDEDVPVALQNRGLAKAVEPIVESYSTPDRHEIDPSGLVACFYYVFYGIMLSDAAYGIIMAGACGFLLKKFRNMEESLKQSLTMFFWCGVSTTIWGFLFGSLFGNAVNAIATTFFGRSDIALRPLWFEPLSMPMRMLSFCFLLGLIQLFTGLAAKLVNEVRAKQYYDAFCDVILWYMFVGGCVFLLLSSPSFGTMLGLPAPLPAIVGTIAKYTAIAGAAGIVLTGGRSSKNWAVRIAQGLYSAYGITSYLSDVLSYSRLMALGLATGIIGTVINKIGSLLGRSVIGVIVFIVVFLIGQAMNFAINALGSYVHTNRLQYVEFFGKFYNGGGRKFEPFTEKTKYYKVREET